MAGRKYRFRPLLEWGSKARKEERRLRGCTNEEQAAIDDAIDDEAVGE